MRFAPTECLRIPDGFVFKVYYSKLLFYQYTDVCVYIISQKS